LATVLYSFRRCPYAMRARMALKVSGVVYEHREILLRDKPQEMLDISPKGTIPVLQLKDGRVIEESFEIMLWALDQSDPQNWLAPGLTQMRPLILKITDDFKHHLDRYKYASRYNPAQNRSTIDLGHRQQACEILQEFETRLTGSPFLMGETISLADIAIFPFIRQFSNVQKTWWDTPIFPHLHTWLDGLVLSDLFKSVMQKHPLWPVNPK